MENQENFETQETFSAQPQGDVGMNMAQPAGFGMEPEKKGNKTFVLMFVCIGVIALIAAISLIAFGGGGYKEPLDSVVDYVNDRNTDLGDLVDAALPEFAADPLKDVVSIAMKTGEVDDVKDSMEELYDELESYFGKNVKITYEVKEKEKLDKDDLEFTQETYQDIYKDYLKDMLEEIEDMSPEDYEDMAEDLDISVKDAKKMANGVMDAAEGLKNAKVTAGYELEVEITIAGKDEKESEEFDVRVIKMNGDWTIDYMSLISEFGSMAFGLLGF